MSASRGAAPTLGFAVVWLAFTSVHAFFMIGGVVKSTGWGALVFLGPFYAIFFGVGFWMLAQGLRALSLQRRYGRPVLAPLPPVLPGQALALQVDFDRPWDRQPPLQGEYRWVEVLAKGGSGKVLAAVPVPGAHAPGPRGGQWSGRAVPPPRPDGDGAQRLELVLQPEGMRPGQGWTFTLPLAASPATDGRAVELTPLQAAGIERVLRVIMTVLLAAGSWLLYSELKDWPAVSPFDLVGAGALLLGALVLNDLRDTLRGAGLAGPLDPARAAERLQPFARRTRQRVQTFVAIAVALFFAEVLGLLR